MSDETINKMARAMWQATVDSIGYTDEEATLISGDDWHQFIDYAKAAYPVVSARIAELEKREKHLEEMFHGWRDEANKASARIAELEKALSSVLIGGNHLALLIGADHPLHTASHDEARAHYGSGDIYEIWCCWRTMMNAGPALDARAALKGEN